MTVQLRRGNLIFYVLTVCRGELGVDRQRLAVLSERGGCVARTLRRFPFPHRDEGTIVPNL